MQHTLTRNEYREILIVRHLLKRGFDEDYEYLDVFLNDASIWDRNISGLNHLLSIILEQFEKLNVPNQQVIDYVYDMQDKISFEIQEAEIGFLESLLSNVANPNLSLEEELIIAENGIYGKR